MLLSIHGILTEAEAAALSAHMIAHQEALSAGHKSAGWHAQGVKNNEQLDDDKAVPIKAKVEAALRRNPVFMAAARPKQIIMMLASRYRTGMSYGTHVDDALMNGIRTDLSFTLFLSCPESYDGGALVIEANDGETDFRLPVGSLAIYPTTALHRVDPVTRGERLAVVGWVRSYVRSPEQREILFDLDNTVASLRQTPADRAIMDRLLKVRGNLLRMWAED